MIHSHLDIKGYWNGRIPTQENTFCQRHPDDRLPLESLRYFSDCALTLPNLKPCQSTFPFHWLISLPYLGIWITWCMRNYARPTFCLCSGNKLKCCPHGPIFRCPGLACPIFRNCFIFFEFCFNPFTYYMKHQRKPWPWNQYRFCMLVRSMAVSVPNLQAYFAVNIASLFHLYDTHQLPLWPPLIL